MTLNVVYWAVNENCSKLAQKWLFNTEPGSGDIKKLLNGPLKKENFLIKNIKSVEVNMQSVRWPSTIRPDTGGHAEYLLRVFHRDSEKKKYKLAVLENTPNVNKILASKPTKKSFKKHLMLATTLVAYDQGIHVLPDNFLSKKATSIAFYGMARLANRPFDQLFDVDSFSKINFSNNKYIKSQQGYLRRLNEMSCTGCHQSRSIAGFHFVGIDGNQTLPENAIKVSHSAHLFRDLPRRSAYVKALAQGKPVRQERPFAEHADVGEGGYGDHCALTEDATFKDWVCKPGLKCMNYNAAYNNTHIGVCVSKGAVKSGDHCDVGLVTQVTNPHKDRIIKNKKLACGNFRYCLEAYEGFPGGIYFGGCDSLEAEESCGAIAVGGFNQCLARNELFTNCLRKHTGPISMRACDTKTPCRDDFICAGGKSGAGSCIPPYFLFQLRIDGHPKP